jgi:hypothetical protein
MRILLDECVDQRLAREIVGHFVSTVPQMGWANIKNGELLRRAEREFDVLITVDANLAFQQNVPKFDLAVIVLHAPTNRLADLRLVVPQLLRELPNAAHGRVTDVPSRVENR